MKKSLLSAVLFASVVLPVGADDRDLLRPRSKSPYVFVIFDTSGSMNWTTQCSAADRQLLDRDNDPTTPPTALCDHVCNPPDRDCWAKLSGDDADSKFYQAKEALYEVINQTPNISYGFATYNQDQPRLWGRHWLYRLAASQVNAPIPLLYDGPGSGINDPSGYEWPVAGSEEVFGTVMACTSGSEQGCWRGDNNTSTSADTTQNPAEINETWKRIRAGRIAKQIESTAVSTFIRISQPSGGPQSYRVGYRPVTAVSAAGPPNPLQVDITVDACTNSDCSSRTASVTRRYTYELISDFTPWENGVSGSSLVGGNGYFGSGYQSIDTDTSNNDTCEGWDPNDNAGFPGLSSDSDVYSSYRIKYPTTTPYASYGALMSYGDVVPLNWETDNKDLILQRLAPNVAPGGKADSPPDFRVATYFNPLKVSGQSYYRLANESERPIVPSGSTPIGNSMGDFREWFTGCKSSNCPAGTGWRNLAATNDPDFGCRRVYILFLTDGDNTCSGDNACTTAEFLFQRWGVKTYVVAFGVEGVSGNTLDCLADKGGTGDPIYPKNKTELIDELGKVFGEIQEDVRAFASAAVPSAQAQVADKSFLTTFRPLKDEAVWPGQVDAYLKPLPLTEDGRPDEDDACEAGETSGCHLWDAATEMLAQAPDDAEVAGGNLRLGMGADQRRVFYSEAAAGTAVPRVRRLFQQTAVTAERYDLWRGLNIAFTPGNTTSETAAATRATNIVKGLLVEKVGDYEIFGDHDNNPTTPDQTFLQTIRYVLGDIFHSDPVLVGDPANLLYYSSRLYDNGRPCDDLTAPNPSYVCFAERHRYRRKVLLLGSNDGQLHAFDAGKFQGSFAGSAAASNLRIVGAFDNGTGREIWSFIPRAVMPKLEEYAIGDEQDWSVDGRVVVDDFYIDPSHGGTPTASDRQWRSVVIGGLREGGAAYYALDITQPDTLSQIFLPQPSSGYVPSCTGQPAAAAGCGTLRYPQQLWEFTDGWDEDGNGRPDLGDAWSIPNTGRISVRQGGLLVDKFVAVFGGGMDPTKANSRGDWLYIVDVETGQAIYKRPLEGSAPSEVAAVDTNVDGYIDTIYAGTTAGFLYKVDLLTPPTLAPVTVVDLLTGTSHVVNRLIDAEIEPYKIFDTAGLPIYYPPSVFFIPELTRYALAFGTGDREDLWQESGQSGHFYVFVDQGFTANDVASGDLPLSSGDLQEVSVEAPGAAATNVPGANYLLRPPSGLAAGWYLALDANERMITKTLVISGVVAFSTYSPDVVLVPEGTPGVTVCSRTGRSRVFVVLATNADAIINTADANEAERLQRFWEVADFVTNPYTESGVTKNPGNSGDSSGEDDSEGDTDALTESLRAINQRLRSLFPDSCKFANPTIDLKTIRSDTGVFFIAPIPVCLDDKSWREN